MSEDLHLSALLQGKDHYVDPETGYRVFTELYLVRRGECCGSGCRHCPYSESWKNSSKTATMNSCAS
ncbi:MAG: hypothetical protein KGP28_12140 [Bdellovibrionales bacterium]|nr:hypothetical protein [Bdellovibrionales bacterium]